MRGRAISSLIFLYIYMLLFAKLLFLFYHINNLSMPLSIILRPAGLHSTTLQPAASSLGFSQLLESLDGTRRLDPTLNQPTAHPQRLRLRLAALGCGTQSGIRIAQQKYRTGLNHTLKKMKIPDLLYIAWVASLRKNAANLRERTEPARGREREERGRACSVGPLFSLNKKCYNS
jgi:hypothetical protein